MKRILSSTSADRGQILIITAGGLIIFLLVAGLMIDGGIAFRERRMAQNASDLASMAGTKVVATHYINGGVDGGDVYEAVVASLEANGCSEASNCAWEAIYVAPLANSTNEVDLTPVVDSGAIPEGAQGVRVSTSREPSTFFMKLVGIHTVTVRGTGTAMTSSYLDGSPANILLPVGIYSGEDGVKYESGTVYQFTEGKNGPGNFGWLTWSGSQAATTLGNSVCVPDNPEMTFSVWMDGHTGATNSEKVRACLDEYIANGTEVLIPLWYQTNQKGGSNLQYEIVGLAAFKLTSYENPGIKTIQGEFVEMYNLPSVPGGYGAPPCNPITDPDCGNRTNFIGLTR
jgi:Flp pilus assembly protein TadG